MIRRRRSSAGFEDQQAQEFFPLILESSLSGSFIVQNNLFRYVNLTFARIFGYEPDEIIGKLSPIELTAPEDRHVIAKLLSLPVKGVTPQAEYSIHGISKDGRTLEIDIRGTVVRNHKQPTIVGTIIDRSATAAVEYKFQRLLSEDIAAYYVVGKDGLVIECNDAFVRLLGFSSKMEAINSDFRSLCTSPGLREAFMQLLHERKHVENHEAEYAKRDGNRVYVIENAFAEFDSAGEIKTIRGYLLDNTSRRKLEGQLYQSQKLENLGTLVGGIAHDFNNVLAIISGHTSVINRSRFDDERFETSVDAIKKASKRGAHVVKQLLTFARKVDLITESVNVGEIVEEISALCKETFTQKITFEIDVEKGLPTIHADPNQMHQVLLNLCVNARDAMPAGGKISIAASRVSRSMLNGNFTEVEAQEYVLLKIADSGMGMGNETLSHIFEPFFTTKKQGQGTGLGLAVVYGIIKSHHGFIDVRSKPGKGTTFMVYLPVPVMKIEVPEVPREILDAVGGSGQTILVVEDEEPLRDFVESTLRYSGYKVLSSGDGLEAAEIYARHEGEIDLVLLDMGLPKMNGSELLSVLKKLNPDIRVIAASGYLEPELKTEIFQQGAVDFLTKPYMAAEMLKKISQALHLQLG